MFRSKKLSKFDKNKFGIFSQFSMAEYMGYTQHTLLKDADQMSMAVGLEIREPFFDHDLIQVGIHRIDHLELATLKERMAHDHDIPPAHAGVLGIGDDAISDAINRRAKIGIPASNIVPILSRMVR
jgi:asparagine synthetase B (glutamine-hydrolysing)